MTTYADIFNLGEVYYNKAKARFHYICEVVEVNKQVQMSHEVGCVEYDKAQKRDVLWSELKTRVSRELRFLNLAVRGSLKQYIDKDYQNYNDKYYIEYDISDIPKLNLIYNQVFNDIASDLFSLHAEAEKLQVEADEDIYAMLDACIIYFNDIVRPCSEANYKNQMNYLGLQYDNDVVHDNFINATPDNYKSVLLEL
jgi:hypothetical protein